MSNIGGGLEILESLAAGAVADAVGSGALRVASDDDLVEVLRAAGRVQRLLEAVLIEATGEVAGRSESPVRGDRMTSRFGCHDTSELVQRVTLVSPQTAGRWARAAKAVRAPVSMLTGEPLEAPLPALRSALTEGAVGVDGVLAVGGPILAAADRSDRAGVLLADEMLAAHARGEGADGAPPVCAEMLRVHASAWAAVLDQDGAEPREQVQIRKRGVVLGTATEHGTPLRGVLMPEVAAHLQHLFDAFGTPVHEGVRFTDPHASDETADPAGPRDSRSRAQKQHDALAAILGVAASSGFLPTIGGAAPTLVVSIRAEDLADGTGFAYAQGTPEPVSPAAARHVACTGVIQRVVTDAKGRILRLGTEERVFSRHQRRAIALRDGGCIIPGCGVRAAWCEIHHVTEHADGGPTHTDNGVLLCWHHHRFLDTHGWGIRMRAGVPEVRAPSWHDPTARWRAATTSPTRLRDTVRRI